MGVVHRGRESRRRGCGFCCLWRHGLNVQASSHDGLGLDSEGSGRSPVWGICRARARPSAARAFAIPQVAAGRVVRDEPLLSRIIGRHTVGAVERGEGWLCQDAGVVEFAAARGPAHGAMAAGPKGAWKCSRGIEAMRRARRRSGPVRSSSSLAGSMVTRAGALNVCRVRSSRTRARGGFEGAVRAAGS